MPSAWGPGGAAAGLPPWPVAVSAIGGGVAVASSAATLVDWALGGGIEEVFVVIGALAALSAVAAGGYALHVLGATLGPTMHGLVVGAIAVGFVHLGAFVILPWLLSWLFGCPELPPCEGSCGCEGCGDCDPDPCPPCPPAGSDTGGPCGGGSGGGGGGGTGGGCGCIAWPGAAGLAGLLTARPDELRNAFAHHPDDPAFAEDVFRVAGLRLCIGCTVTFPTFLGAAIGLPLLGLPVPWWGVLGLGAVLTSLQGLSAAGETTTKARKVLVKLALGLGTAGLLVGVRASPWPAPAQALVLLGLLAVVLASTLPRSRRMAARQAG